MRNTRIPGPPSTQSGSSSSGRELMHGSHRNRALPPEVFVPGSSDEGTSKKTRTKAIIILGIALPVLACIIGIAAWAVTTDVLRISPRAHDNAFNRFGHQGKTRIDSLQPRNDQDIDIFQLHGISQASSTNPPLLKKDDTPLKSLQTSPIPPVLGTMKFEKNPKASDILSKLISDMPTPKRPTNFVVFAPVADTSSKKIPSDGRRFDGKVVHDGEDLVAEESVYSFENSQESIERKTPFSRRRKSSRESTFSKKSAEIPSHNDMKLKKNTNPHYFPRGKSRIEDDSRFIKRLHNNPEETIPSQRGNEAPPSPISNRNSANYPTRANTNEHLSSNNFNTRGSNKQGFQQLENVKAATQQRVSDTPPHYPAKDGNGIPNYSQSAHLSQNARPFPNHGKGISYPPPNNANNGVLQSKGTFSNAPRNQPNIYTQQPTQNSNQNQPLQHNLKYSGSNLSPQQSLNNQPMPPQQIQQYAGPNHHSQHMHSKQPIPSNQGQPSRPIQHQESYKVQTSPPSPQFSNPQGYQAAPPPSFQGNPPPSSYNPPPQSPPPTYGNSNHPQYQHSLPDNTHASNGGPQYFAPPPQTFHTKTSYDNPPSKFHGSSSVASYERVAQSTVEQSKDGHHHHHHHHHHHEPIASNSDPIGDVNLSDVPRTNDADRLGTIGLGISPPRGITVQIGGGGGGGGGGLTGLLPLGALGIAKNIVSSLLPRPAFGLNSKVFLGVEVGRGGGGLSSVLG